MRSLNIPLFKYPISVPLQNLTTKPIFKLQWVQHRTNIVNYGDPAHITILHISNSNSSLSLIRIPPTTLFCTNSFPSQIPTISSTRDTGNKTSTKSLGPVPTFELWLSMPCILLGLYLLQYLPSHNFVYKYRKVKKKDNPFFLLFLSLQSVEH